MSTLVIGNHYWGHGTDLATAKTNFRKNGGKLGDGYTIVDFGDNLVFNGVDDLGRVFWLAGSEDGDEEPKTTDVQPRKRR